MGKTSNIVRQRYLKKTYTQLSVRLKKRLVDDFKNKVMERGDVIAEVIRQAIVRYLDEAENTFP
jgi:metal-responsive CopG/Arc/MetJ family transcriptional regulator